MSEKITLNPEQKSADAETDFCSNFKRTGKRKNCFFVPGSSTNPQPFVNGLNKWIEEHTAAKESIDNPQTDS